MDQTVKNLQGSPLRDKFKYLHKNGDRDFYSCDIDFCFVSGRGIVAFIDAKGMMDSVTWTESIAYKDLMKIAPVYLVYIHDGINLNGPFSIYKYLCGYKGTEQKELILNCENWGAFFNWERSIRK